MKRILLWSPKTAVAMFLLGAVFCLVLGLVESYAFFAFGWLFAFMALFEVRRLHRRTTR